MLTVVDNELRRHRNVERSDTLVDALKRIEAHFCVHRRRDRREYVVTGVIEDIPRHFRHAVLVQHALCSQLGNEFLFVEQEELRKQTKRAHRHVVGMPCLHPPNRRKDVLEPHIARHGVRRCCILHACLSSCKQTESLTRLMATYLDCNATTPVDPRVAELVLLLMRDELQRGQQDSRIRHSR